MKPRPAAAFGKSSRNVEHAQIFSGWLGNAALPFLCPDCSRAFWVCHRRVRGFRLEDVCITLMGSEMNVPRLTAEASLYATSQHYHSAIVGGATRFDSVLAQQLCRQLGQSCGGVDLFCCPGLTCTAGLGGRGICVPDGGAACCPPGC